MEILCFFAGVVFFYTKSLYPLLFIIIALLFNNRWFVIIWFLTAIFWSFFHQWLVADSGMPEMDVIPKGTLIGRVNSIPKSDFSKTQFQFAIHQLNNEPVKATVLMSCYDHCPIFKTGQIWQLQAKLKKPKNLANPGHFDYQGNLNARHVAWTGYLKSGDNKLLNDSKRKTSIMMLREKLSATLKPLIPDKDSRGIVEALTLGITNNIDSSLWDLFRRTGTTHLMVISGAHISLVAGFAYWVFRRLWSLSSRLCLFCPAVKAAGLGAITVVFVYALLAGFAVPAQRALIACFFLMLCHFFNRRFTGWQSWRYALLVVLIYEPHAVLLPGFYLSFMAVATLIASSQRIPYSGMKKTLCLQLACLFGLMPFTLYWFAYGAINGFAANLIAIPIVGYLLVPLSLVSVFLASTCAIPELMLPVEITIKTLLFYLKWIDQFSLVNVSFSLHELASVFALLLGGILLFFMPIKIFFPASLTLLIFALFPGHSSIKPNEAQIDVLDVGEGLSIVVRTAMHTLIYDTGMKFYKGGDMAQMVIIPYLQTQGIKNIDTVVISHPDLDHRGGLPSLEKKYSINELLVDNVAFYQRGKNCHEYPDWQWDGISFRFLPIKQIFRDKNNSSCVLQISNKAGKILLPGDIEKPAENYLASVYREQLASDVLVVAHHGSKTSSTPAFIRQVSPRYSIISAGFDNRYHFPHQQTIATLAKENSKVFNTMTCGMTSIHLSSREGTNEPTCYSKTN